MDQINQEQKKSMAIPPWVLVVIGIIGVLLLIAFLSNPEGFMKQIKNESQFTIKLTGTSGLKFNGVYAATLDNGSTTTQSVEGVLPTQYSVIAKVVSVSFQKETTKGTLRVDILKENTIIKSSETSATYGNVMIVTE